MDLGGYREIRSITTQGRAGFNEFVTEYIVQYSDDGEGWRSFSDSQGEVKVLLTYCGYRLKMN